MKLSTRMYVLGKVGRWVAYAGGVVIACGLALLYLSAGPAPAANVLLIVGLFLAVGGLAYDFVAGDHEPIPEPVKAILDDLGAADEAQAARRARK